MELFLKYMCKECGYITNTEYNLKKHICMTQAEFIKLKNQEQNLQALYIKFMSMQLNKYLNILMDSTKLLLPEELMSIIKSYINTNEELSFMSNIFHIKYTIVQEIDNLFVKLYYITKK